MRSNQTHGIRQLGVSLLAMIVLVTAGPALAGKTVVMTDTTRAAALAALQPGDTLQLEGVFNTILTLSNRDFGGVQVNAHGASLLQGMRLNDVQNIAVSGGTFGSATVNTREWYAVTFERVTNVSLSSANIIGTGSNNRGGMLVRTANFLTLRDNQVSGVRMGIHIGGARDSLITNNHFNDMTEDGLRLISSNRVIVSENRCTNFIPHSTAHPDCVQMWTGSESSALGLVQSDIYVMNNTAIGDMQAFVSLDPRAFSGERITFAGNYAAVSYPHGISCLGCRDSLIKDNVLVTMPNSQWETTIRTGTAVSVVRENNPRFDLRHLAGTTDFVLPDRIWSDLVPTLDGRVGSDMVSRMWNSRSQSDGGDGGGDGGDNLARFGVNGAAVPEPESWVLFLLGFALVGRALRNHRSGPRHALA